MTWTSHPEARLLLAELGANPPAKRVSKYAFGDHEAHYIGAGVRRLRRLRKAALDAALKRGDRTRDYSEFDRICALTVEQAIDDAQFHAAIRRSKEADEREVATLKTLPKIREEYKRAVA